MADNYLEKKFEEFYGGRKPSVKHPGVSLDGLLARTRRDCVFDVRYKVHRLQLERIAGVGAKALPFQDRPSLHFHLVTAEDPEIRALQMEADGRADAEAFIIIGTAVPEDRYVDMQLGSAVQTMILKAAELGLTAVFIPAFDRSRLRQQCRLSFDPLAVLTVGKPLC